MIAVVVLAVCAAAVTAGSWLTRRPTGPPVGLDGYLSRPVRAWLALVYPPAAVLARLGVRPALLTASGVVAAYGVWALTALGGAWPIAGAALLVASATLDGLDGAVALLGGRAGALGGIADSVADRAAEICFALALWQAGAPAGLAVAAGAAGALPEYLRARAGALGVPTVLVTAGERPARLIVTGLALLLAGAVPGRAGQTAGAGAAAVTALGLLAAGQLSWALWRQARPIAGRSRPTARR
jgi:phosphatidylglycerophosphate synthase